MKPTIEERIEFLEARVKDVTRRNLFLWGNEEKFTRKEYEWFVAQQYYDGLHRFPNLKHPRRLGEKILWLKLHYQHPLMGRVTDKYRAKKYVADQIGEKYVIPLLGVWDSVWDIDFDALPKRFVIKCNNWAGGRWGNYIVRDKSKINRDVMLYNLQNWSQVWQDCFYHAVIEARRKPVIFAEEYIEDTGRTQLRDYKFMCFHGEPQFFWIDADRAVGHKRNLYDIRGNLLSAKLIYPNFDDEHALPERLDEMLHLARKLSVPFPHMRVDFYETNGGGGYTSASLRLIQRADCSSSRLTNGIILTVKCWIYSDVRKSTLLNTLLRMTQYHIMEKFPSKSTFSVV